MVQKNGLNMERNKSIKTWLLLAAPVVLIITLFAMRDKLVGIGATEMNRLQSKAEAMTMADSVSLLYDYSKTGNDSFRYTFLEFGAKGCISCQKMENVMEEIKKGYAGQVNVKFLNLMLKENQPWAKYFGIAMIPTQVILDREGQEVFRHTGYISTEELANVFK